MKNPYRQNSEEWNRCEISNDDKVRNDELIKDMGELISENITKIAYNKKGYLEVEICLSNTSKYTKEQKEHYIFIKDMIQTLYIDSEQFIKWKYWKVRNKFKEVKNG